MTKLQLTTATGHLQNVSIILIHKSCSICLNNLFPKTISTILFQLKSRTNKTHNYQAESHTTHRLHMLSKKLAIRSPQPGRKKKIIPGKLGANIGAFAALFTSIISTDSHLRCDKAAAYDVRPHFGRDLHRRASIDKTAANSTQ